MHMWNMPHAVIGAETQDQKSIRNQFDYSWRARRGPSQWQYDHWKAKYTRQNAKKKNHNSITGSWHNGELYRNSQIAAGCTEDYFRFLDSIATVNISYAATWSARSRYENNLTLGVHDQGPKPGPMKHRLDFSRAVHTLAAIKHQEGTTNPKIPKHLRD